MKCIHSIIIIMSCAFILSSCENNLDNLTDTDKASINIDKLELVDGTIYIDSKVSLKNILKSYQDNVEGQNKFNNEIRKLQTKGFKPLTPIYGIEESEKMEKFILEKSIRMKTMNKSFGITAKTIPLNEIDFEDELIPDPAFAALLNENREIYIGDSLYKYTETGLYFCHKKDKERLYSYLMRLSAKSKMSRIVQRIRPCEEALQGGAYKELTEVEDGIMNFMPMEDCDGTGGGGGGDWSPPPPIPQVIPRLIKQNLSICRIEKQGWLEKIFGETEVDTEEWGDNRRIKVTYWNQNYFIYSSIGCSARFQKRVKILGVSGWQKSYADQIELGINNVEFEYDFNVPMYNLAKYQYDSFYFEYNGTKYAGSGKQIIEFPANKPGFPFNTDNSQQAVTVYIFNKEFDVNFNIPELLNKQIDQQLKNAVNNIPSWMNKPVDLIKNIDEDKIKYEIVKAVPFSNKVQLSTLGVKWTNNDDNAITHYFDFNFLFTWNSDYSNVGDYLNGLKGGKSYSNASVDLYGAALHNGEWRGRRLVLEKK